MRETSPRDLNVNLLNALFRFKPQSKLKSYLTSKTGVGKTYYTLGEVLTILKNIIRGEGQFDENNPSIILCSSELEEALNMRALHVTEIRDLILSHLIKVPDNMLRRTTNDHSYTTIINPPRIVVDESGPPEDREQPYPQLNRMRIFRTQNPLAAANIARQDRFYVKKKFLDVMRTVPGVNLQQQSFTFAEITDLFSKYMLSKQDELFDDRNIRVALIQNDPLATAIGMISFHRCQVNIILRAQLIPATPSSTTQQAGTDTTTTPPLSPVTNLDTEEVHGNVPDNQSEYTNDTEEDTLRPKHAMGEGSLSSGDTDDHMDLTIEQPIETISVDYGYFGDNENVVMSEHQDESTSTVHPKNHKQQTKCAACKELTPNTKFKNFLCPWCWRLRKQWLPYRQQRKKKHRNARDNNENTLTKSLSAPLTESKIVAEREGGGDNGTSISSPSSTLTDAQPATKGQREGQTNLAMLCGICCHKTRDTGFVHGTSAHLYACYQCAKKAWKLSPKCPICRRKVSSIVKII